MEQQNHNQLPPLQKGTNKKQHLMTLLLVFLLLLALFSSVLVGFLIGRNTDPYRGQIIDTIFIGPDQNRTVHVSGQVVYSDGTPYADGTVELRSEPIITTTDYKGRFFYESAPPGAHTLSVLDDDGKAIAKCEFTISRSLENQAVNIKKQADGQYAVELSVDVRFIELAVELDKDSGSLKLIPEKTAVLEDDGTLTTGEKKLNVKDGPVVLPSGTVILSDMTVVVPENLILPDNSVTQIPNEGYVSDSREKVSAEGEVILPDGTVINPDGIKKPDGSIVKPEEAYQVKTEEKKSGTDINETPKPSENPSETPEQQETPGDGQEDTADSGPTGNTPGNSGSTDTNNGSGSSDTPSQNPGGENTDTPSNKPQPEDSGGLRAEGQNAAGWMSWESQSSIDLFYDRTGGSEEKIQPGSKGYYLFRLSNTRLKDLRLTISLTEGSVHIPLKFTLTPLDKKNRKLTDRSVKGTVVNGALILEGTVTAGSETTYQLDWEWPFDGNDEMDTAAGRDGGKYILNIQILAEESV